MRPFSLIVPTDLADASTQGAANDAVFKAAGMDLVDRMKERIDSPPKVVNLLSLRTDLSGINVEASGVRIGALSTLTQVSEAEALQQPAYRALSWAAGDAATPQVRNRATIAGNIIQVNRCWYYRSAGFTCAHQGGEFCLAMFGENRYHSVMGTSNCLRVHPSNVAPTLMVLDVQGYEFEVLKGSERLLADVDIVICEISVEVLYQQQATFHDIYTWLTDRGFYYSGDYDRLMSPVDGRVLQVDAIFDRRAMADS